MENSVIQKLALGSIKADPTQPRKTFTPDSIKELAESIKEVGLLQPITVRPQGKKFIIVMGERRFRACQLLKVHDMECIVKEFEDKDILEAQIIENLQREEVEPLEEADAILLLHEKLKPEEIATKIGRTNGFVHSRLKLAQLIDAFRIFISSKEMPLNLGVKLALLPVDQQKDLAVSMGDTYQEHSLKRALENNCNDLAKAPFDPTDHKLIPKAKACTVCPFNSMNQGQLFGDNKSICSKSSCYSLKTSKYFHNLIDAVKKDGRLLIPNINDYSRDWESNALVLSTMEEKGLKIWLMNDADVLENPVRPTLESISENYDVEEMSEDEINEVLQEELEDYQEELDAYENAKENGYCKGILLEPNDYRTKEVLVKISECCTNGVTNKPIEKKKMDECTPTEKVEKLLSRELRKKQLESNKQFEEVIKMVRDSDYHNTKKTLSTDEMVAFCFNLFENHLSWYSQRDFFKGFLGNTEKKNRAEVVEQFRKNFKKEMFHKLIRFVMARQVHFGEQNHINNNVNISFYTAVRPYLTKDIEEIEAVYEEKRIKRENRLKERIKALEKENELLRSA